MGDEGLDLLQALRAGGNGRLLGGWQFLRLLLQLGGQCCQRAAAVEQLDRSADQGISNKNRQMQLRGQRATRRCLVAGQEAGRRQQARLGGQARWLQVEIDQAATVAALEDVQ